MVTTLNEQQRTIILIPSYRYGDENSDKQESRNDAILSKEEKKNYRVLLKSKLPKCVITFISPSGWILWFGHRTANLMESSRETG